MKFSRKDHAATGLDGLDQASKIKMSPADRRN